MPYAQDHYPFENKEAFDQSFPADFIGEGLDLFAHGLCPS